MNTVDTLDTLVRKFKIHQKTIEVLFEISSPPNEAQFLVLADKLAAVQNLLSSLPAQFDEKLFDEWNEKLAQWWKSYAIANQFESSTSCTSALALSTSNNGMLLPNQRQVSVLTQIDHSVSFYLTINTCIP